MQMKNRSGLRMTSPISYAKIILSVCLLLMPELLKAELILPVNDKPCPGTPTVTYQGKTYHTILIGSQCWLKENIDAGTMIKGSESATDNGKIEKYCAEDDPANCTKYGGLYTWNEAMQFSSTGGKVQGVCPSDWHLPNLDEFKELQKSANNVRSELEEKGQEKVSPPDINATGFSSLRGGYRHFTGTFDYAGDNAYYWGSSEDVAGNANLLYLSSGINYMVIYYNNKDFGLSIRCIKD